MNELLVARLARFSETCWEELRERSTLDWILFFAPLLVLELPRYYLRILGVLVLSALGLPRRREPERAAILRRAPRVSLLLVGRNEGDSISSAIESALAQDYPDFEVIVVDDDSQDEMFARARRRRVPGRVRIVRNASGRGRTGKPAASNVGLRLATGEILVAVDADTDCAPNLVREIVSRFSDPRVGLVAGNVRVGNAGTNLLTRLQAIEYALSIDLQRRWTDFLGCTFQVSGAIFAVRRAALEQIGGWDPELAEDTDLSLRMLQAGWKVAFAPEALVHTRVPATAARLARQRTRWDRGYLRALFRKHKRLLRPSAVSFALARELWGEWVFVVLATLIHPLYLLWLASQGLPLFVAVTSVTAAASALLALLVWIAVSFGTSPAARPGELLGAALLLPTYKALLRWVRLRALVLEFLRVDYEDPFLPDTAWFHAPRP